MTQWFRIEADVRGLEEVRRVFAALPREIARKALRGALLDGAEVVRSAVKARTPVRGDARLKKIKGSRYRRPGLLKASLVKRITRAPVKHDMTARVRFSGRAWYGRLVEFGHRLVRRKRGQGKRVVGQVPAHPFMMPAFQAVAGAAAQRTVERLGPRINAVIRGMRRRLAKAG